MENQIDQLMKALAALHKEFGVVISKDRKGHKGTYASLPCILVAIHEMCHPHNLLLYQSSCIIEGKNCLLSVLYHTPSGQSISSVSLLTPNPDPQSHDQAWGGSSTYHRRYDAMMLLGIFSENDATDHNGDNECISLNQLGFLTSLLQGNKDMEATILKRCGISELNQIPRRTFNAVLEFVKKK